MRKNQEPPADSGEIPENLIQHYLQIAEQAGKPKSRAEVVVFLRNSPAVLKTNLTTVQTWPEPGDQPGEH